MPNTVRADPDRADGPYLLILLYMAASCTSLVLVATRYGYFHIYFDQDLLANALFGVTVICAMIPIFTFTKFSFGWSVGLYLYVTAAGFIWISYFSPLYYDHQMARISIGTSIAALLLPALLITGTTKRTWSLTQARHEQILLGIIVFAIFTIALCSTYGFQFVGLDAIYEKREDLRYPTLLNYLININVTTLLPYAFAAYFHKKRYFLVAVIAIIQFLFYPVTFSKLVLAAPAWLMFLVVLSRWFTARTSIVLSLVFPLFIGLIAFFFDRGYTIFGTINFRMFAIPASTIDHYSEFFAHHPVTSFCQISFLKSVMNCPYSDPLSVIMQNTYKLGNMNASLLATDGIASVGLEYAPISALVCGLAIAIGNLCSAHLSERFVLLSGAVLTQAILNVPFTTTLLTHGAIILFLLWYITPFESLAKTPRE